MRKFLKVALIVAAVDDDGQLFGHVREFPDATFRTWIKAADGRP